MALLSRSIAIINNGITPKNTILYKKLAFCKIVLEHNNKYHPLKDRLFTENSLN
jgi:hypothetical protein